MSSMFVRMIQKWDERDGGGGVHSVSWMIVSARCSCLVTALCRVSLVWVSVPLLQLNLPYHCGSGAAWLPHCPWMHNVSLVQRNRLTSPSQGDFVSKCAAHELMFVWLCNIPGILPTTCTDRLISSSQFCLQMFDESLWMFLWLLFFD